jgi:hypothetical protein
MMGWPEAACFIAGLWTIPMIIVAVAWAHRETRG